MRSADAYNVDLRDFHHLFDAIERTHAVLFTEGLCSIERGAAYRHEVRVLEVRERPGMEMTYLSATDDGRSEFFHDDSVYVVNASEALLPPVRWQRTMSIADCVTRGVKGHRSA